MIHRSLREPRCYCGSGKFHRPAYDARGIFLTFVCDKCEQEKLKEFDPDVLVNPNYQTDEPIDAD